jgi:murein DD-endopeptidase MepM/ murein hydrolase activator NlpD
MPRLFRLLNVAMLFLLLPGCASLWPAPYGEAAPDAEPVRADGQPVFMPPNAPSILNGHWADYDGHPGIDMVGEIGLPVLAPADGVVIASLFEPMYGHNIVLEHAPDADGAMIRTRLVHLDDRLVVTGERVRQGQRIGSLGRTGLLAGGIPHLHYEVLRREPGRFASFETVNPHLYWTGGPGIVTCFDPAVDYPAGRFLATFPVACR